MSTMFSKIGKNDMKSLKKYLEKESKTLDDMVSLVRYKYSVQPMIYTRDVTDTVTEETINAFCKVLSFAGLLDRLPEKLIDAGSALSGCGPAYTYIFLEALADGAVACGIPRAKALEYAAATLEGAARMYLETRTHPGALKDAVCSPGGSTLAGLRALEQNGFRSAAIECVHATYNKNKELGK